jgi:hypothetical protein
MGERYMSKSNKLKCRHCGSDDLYLQQYIITRSDVCYDSENNVVYEEPEYFPDEVIEEFTCYCCADCGHHLTLDDEYGSSDVVSDDNLQEYCQKYCSGD